MRKLSTPLICIVLLIVAVIGAAVLVKTAPEAERKRPPKTAALIDTIPLNQVDETIVVHLTGTVVPADEIKVNARIVGEVVSMNPEFMEGGFLEKGADILKIDPIDFELALANARSTLETARFNHKLELGRQDVARREWELLKTDDATEQERELALRIPHLAASKAALESAEARVENAKLDLERTDIRAPFNALVLERNVNIGSQAKLQDALARLVCTDAYWITVSIPMDRLNWISVPGSTVEVLSASGTRREGKVIKLLGDLEEKGRMARLLVEVEDPLCLTSGNGGQKPLLLGEFVRTQVNGTTLENVFSIPREALHENDIIWIATTSGKLDVREVDVLWRDSMNVIIRDGVQDGDLLIVSDLTAPIHGMDINTGNDGIPNAGKSKKKPANKE